MLNDEQWSRIENRLPGRPQTNGGQAGDNRKFVEAVLYVAKTGCLWSRMPKEMGRWHSVYVRYRRWEEYGAWHMIAEVLWDVPEVRKLFKEAAVPSARRPPDELWKTMDIAAPSAQ